MLTIMFEQALFFFKTNYLLTQCQPLAAVKYAGMCVVRVTNVRGNQSYYFDLHTQFYGIYWAVECFIYRFTEPCSGTYERTVVETIDCPSAHHYSDCNHHICVCEWQQFTTLRHLIGGAPTRHVNTQIFTRIIRALGRSLHTHNGNHADY